MPAKRWRICFCSGLLLSSAPDILLVPAVHSIVVHFQAYLNKQRGAQQLQYAWGASMSTLQASRAAGYCIAQEVCGLYSAAHTPYRPKGTGRNQHTF
jgi:hypothetical protein